MSEDSNKKDVLVGLIAGIAAGFAAGILLAPKSGQETRADIKKGADKAWSFANEKLHMLIDELEALVVKGKAKLKTANLKTREELNELITKAKNAQRMSREVARAFKAGEADDSDLDMAVKEAAEARNHLRDYLTKQK